MPVFYSPVHEIQLSLALVGGSVFANNRTADSDLPREREETSGGSSASSVPAACLSSPGLLLMVLLWCLQWPLSRPPTSLCRCCFTSTAFISPAGGSPPSSCWTSRLVHGLKLKKIKKNFRFAVLAYKRALHKSSMQPLRERGLISLRPTT